MSKFLFAWELGTGLGHVGKLFPIANELQKRGHEIVAAIKDLGSISTVENEKARFPVLSSRAEIPTCRKDFAITSTYCQLLHNVGFGDEAYLAMRIRTWQDIFAVVKPDLLVCDHSPMAMLAARTIRCPIALVGTGFSCPPTEQGLPDLDKRHLPDAITRQRQEQHLLVNCNRVLKAAAISEFSSISEIYSQTTASFLLTHPELDHFGARKSGQYWGSWNFTKSPEIAFPKGIGPKVFGYLKASPNLSALLDELSRLKWPALIVGSSIPKECVEKYSNGTLCVMNRPVDIESAAKWCDFSILNATHASVAVLLRAGKPILNIPLQSEQMLMARRVVEHKMGGAVASKDPQAHKLGLNMMGQRYQELASNAQQFASKYQSYDQMKSLQQVTDQIEKLI